MGKRFSVVVLIVVLAGLGGASSASALTPPLPRAELFFHSEGRIISVQADGTDRRVITDPVVPESDYFDEMGDSTPSVSPDGQQIMFTRYLENNNFESSTQIILAHRTGGSEKVLVEDKDDDSSYAAAWSPDGTSIYFLRYRETGRRINSEIRLIRADGSGEKLISRTSMTFKGNSIEGSKLFPIGIAPSPVTGKLLVSYFPIFGYKRTASYLVDPSTGKRKLLQRDAGSGSWSPDGSKIVFVSERARIDKSCYEGRCSFDSHLYVMNADGSGVRKLIPGKPIGYQAVPDWSPDGQRIAFVGDRTAAGRSGSPEIFTVAPDGSCLSRITNGSPDGDYPEWGPEADRSSVPAQCGDLAPDPLVEQPLSKFVTGLKLTPLWAGHKFGNRLLNDVFKDGRGVSFSYGDCSAFKESDCAPFFDINSAPVCEEQNDAAFYAGTYAGLSRFNGGLVMYTRNTDRYGFATHFYSGGLETTIRTLETSRGKKMTRADHRAILRQLRPVTATEDNQPEFAPAVFTRRQVDRAMEKVRKADRDERIAGKSNRAYLKFGRALGRNKPFKTTKCKRFYNVGTPSTSGV